MVTIFKDNMGDYHVWRANTCKDFEYKGLHGTTSTCDGKKAPIFVQTQISSFEREVISKISPQSRQKLDSGYTVKTTKFDFEDLRGYHNT